MTRALVVGAGSIGLRHARLLGELGHDVAVVTKRADTGLASFPTVASALDGFDPEYVVIATETAGHGDAVSALATAGFHGDLLVEKPLAVHPEALDAGFGRVGVAFNLRFHSVIVALRTALEGQPALTVEAYAGQHLSTWRPSRPVADQYSAHAAQGGGVLRDLSHELDYLALLFGACTGVFARGGRLGSVTVDSDDAWGIVAEHERAPLVTLQVNYLDTRTRRRIVVNTGDSTIEADLVARTLTVDGDVTDLPGTGDDSYRDLHVAMLGDPASPVTTVAEAGAVDDVIAMIERSAATQTWVSTP